MTRYTINADGSAFIDGEPHDGRDLANEPISHHPGCGCVWCGLGPMVLMGVAAVHGCCDVRDDEQREESDGTES